MDTLLSTPGMTVATVVVVTVLILSLLLLWVNVRLFRVQARKYQTLIKDFGNEEAWGTPGWLLIPLYCLTTFVATVVIALLFVFQPHLF